MMAMKAIMFLGFDDLEALLSLCFQWYWLMKWVTYILLRLGENIW